MNITTEPASSEALAALENLDQAFVLLDEALAPIYLSRHAALLLGVSDRSRPDEHVTLFHELLNVTKLAARRQKSRAIAHNHAPLVRHVTLRSATGRNFDALANPRPVSGPQWNVGGREGAFLICIRDTSCLEAFAHMLEQTRRLRPLLIFASCVTGQDLRAVHASSEKMLRNLIVDDDVPVADLLQNVSRAVEVADPLVPPNVKIVLELRQAVLLRVSALRVTRLIAHLIVEGADFIGLHGEIRLRMEQPKKQEKRTVSDSPAEIGILVAATRHPLALNSPDALDNYILRRMLPHHHRVTVADEEAAGVSVSLQDLSRKHGVALRDADSHSISPESMSDNGQLCARLAEEAGAELSFKKAGDKLLAMHLRLPLATETAPFSKKPEADV